MAQSSDNRQVTCKFFLKKCCRIIEKKAGKKYIKSAVLFAEENPERNHSYFDDEKDENTSSGHAGMRASGPEGEAYGAVIRDRRHSRQGK